MMNASFTTIGVVPIFVNAVPALVPTLVAAFSTIAAVILKPSELIGLIRRKPWVPVLVILVGVGLWFGIAHLVGSPAKAATEGRAGAAMMAPTTDWTKVALKLIQDKENAGKTTGVVPVWANTNYDGWVLSSTAYGSKADRDFGTATVQDVASMFGLLYCLDANSGKQIWKAEKAGDDDLKAFFSSPALTEDQKSLIVGQGLHADADCNLLCFDTSTGNLRWKVKTPLHIESSPAVHGDLAVVGAGAIEGADHKPTTHPGYVLAVRISDGKELWKYDIADPESSPAIASDGSVYIGSGFNGNAVVALRSESDDELKAKNLPRLIWKTQAPYPITGPVTLVDDYVVVGGGNGDFVNEDPNPAGVVMLINRKDGSIKWSSKTDAAVLGTIVARDGKLYCPVRNGTVVALNLADGKPVWKQSVSEINSKAPVLAGVALTADGHTLFAVSNDGYLALLAAADGHVVERHPLNRKDKPGERGLTLSTPTLAGDKVFLGSETGGIQCFRAAGPSK
jgi:outer membrane protein assembly factor BamB